MEIHYQINKSTSPKCQVILAHGAGANMYHEFFESLATELIKLDINIIRFNFSYIEEGKKLPGSQTKSVANWKEIIQITKNLNPNIPIFIGGKSYGGRMASHCMIEEPKYQEFVKGLFYLGYPLHPIGKPSLKKAEHLHLIQIPQLFLQGTRDKLADIGLIEELITILKISSLSIFENADHSFQVPKKMGGNMNEMYKKLAETIDQWILSQLL